VDRIATHPRRFPEITAGVRRARLRRFPYGLFFRQLEDAIHVIACFHVSRDPLVWQSRMEPT
jgi:toxin ParE1/3/4